MMKFQGSSLAELFGLLAAVILPQMNDYWLLRVERRQRPVLEEGLVNCINELRG